MLTCADLNFAYQGVMRLKRVSLTVADNSLVALFGHNGSGKSTLLKLLGGSLPVQSGGVEVFQKPAIGRDGYLRTDMRHHFGLLFQGTSSDEKLSLMDNLIFSARLFGLSRENARERALWALAQASLSDRAREPVKKLSGGMRRRLELYRCFLHWPKIVLLDEPTAGLDSAEVAKFFDFLKAYLKETRASVIMASHHADELLFADLVCMMKDGEIIAQGTPNAMLAKLDYLRCVFQCAHEDSSSLRELPLYDWQTQADDSISAKLRTSALDALLKNPILRDAPFKSFSIERPSLAHVYRDLCEERISL